MKKIVLFAAFVAFFCGSFVACTCSSKKDNKKEQATPAAAATEEESSQDAMTVSEKEGVV